MSKVMLVEDDNNLREIYEARLQAEGYTIVTAHDGEEALVVAKAEQPDLIISDVMMPKISGFEMLDILRNTEGMKDVKVIMLTALGQSDDQQRADRLGADSYLVKSQVTLEDIVKVAARLLGDYDATPPLLAAPVAAPFVPVAVPVEAAPVAAPFVPVAVPVEAVSAPTPAIVSTPTVVAPTTDAEFIQSLGASSEATPIPAAQPLAEEAATVDAQIAAFADAASEHPAEFIPTEVADTAELAPVPGAQPAEAFVATAPLDLASAVTAPDPSPQSAGNDDVLATALESLTGIPPAPAPTALQVPARPMTSSATTATPVVQGGNRVITPLNMPDKPDISTLLALEEAKEMSSTTAPTSDTPAASAAQPQPSTPPTNPTTPPPVDPNTIAL